MPIWIWIPLLIIFEAIVSLVVLLGFFIFMEKYGERIFIKLRILKNNPSDKT